MSQTEMNVMTANAVEQYLKDNPDFFSHRPELVEQLTLPHHQQGTVSLVHVQLNRQRQKIEELEEEITTLMSLAAKNDLTFHRLMVLQEAMLKSKNLCDVFQQIHQTATKLGLMAHIRLFDAPTANCQLDSVGWQRFSTNYLNGKSVFLGRLRKVDRIGLFGEQVSVPEFGSYVVLPLSTKFGHGFLAFSSEDGGHFQPCMDTLFLRHLSDVLVHLINELPWQSPL